MTESWLRRAYESVVRSRADRIMLLVVAVACAAWGTFALWFYLAYGF
jgi:hypothetical protein